MCYVKLCGLKWSDPKKFGVGLFTFLGTVGGWLAAVLSLLDIVGVIDLGV
jgi:hypothetical protein